MKGLINILSSCFGRITIFALLAVSVLQVQAETNSVTDMNRDFVKTNGDSVFIGDISFKTNSSLNTEEFKQFMWRVHQLDQIENSGVSNVTDKVVEGNWGLIRDFQKYADSGYESIMAAMGDYEFEGQPEKARTLADQLVVSSSPQRFKLWAKGFLNRLDSEGKPISIQFTAIDGRQVNLNQMRGKVVLVDFWGTHCGPCVASLPRVKVAWETFHKQGFEVISISCDTDKRELEQFVKQHGISWPQYFDGKQQEENKFTVEFGIDGIPHMFLIDKNGNLRFDNVQARDNVHPKGDNTSFEEKISKLLAEN